MALMASILGCNFVIYLALDVPNSEVIARSTARLNPVKKLPMTSQICSKTSIAGPLFDML
jgi:hypothetical protein